MDISGNQLCKCPVQQVTAFALSNCNSCLKRPARLIKVRPDRCLIHSTHLNGWIPSPDVKT